MFPRVQLYGGALKAAECCHVQHAVLHQSRRAIELEVLFDTPQPGDICSMLERAICADYSLSELSLKLVDLDEVPLPEEFPATTVSLPPEEDIPLPEEPPMPEEAPDWMPPPDLNEEDLFNQTEALREEKLKAARKAMPKADPSKRKRREPKAPGEDMLYGKSIRGHSIPISDISLDLGTVCVTGRIFADNSRELKKRNAWVVSFDITDDTNSVTVSKFMENKQAEPLMKELKKGKYVTVEGKLSLSHYTNDLELAPFAISKADPPPARKDTSEEKRVELHLHTRFSTMDATVEVKEAVKRAIAWA